MVKSRRPQVTITFFQDELLEIMEWWEQMKPSQTWPTPELENSVLKKIENGLLFIDSFEQEEK